MPVPFRRIVCSATLTTNPQKLAALGLRRAAFFVSREDVAAASARAASAPSSSSAAALDAGLVDDDDDDGGDDDNEADQRVYTLPSTLHQAFTVCAAGEKPIALLHLLRLLEGQHLLAAAAASKAAAGAAASSSSAAAAAAPTGLRALVFAGSVETTHRLCRLLQLYGGLSGRVVEFSAGLSQAKRSAVLEAARAGLVSVLISSDAAARGLDLPSLPAVIHYDVAPRAKTYVHRVGRAARAGKTGLTYSLVRPEQMRHFTKTVLSRLAGGAPESAVAGVAATTLVGSASGGASGVSGGGGASLKETLWVDLVGQYAPRLQAVLRELQRVLERERSGELGETAPVAPLGDGEGGDGGKKAEGAATAVV
jgi:hypothetical protein